MNFFKLLVDLWKRKKLFRYYKPWSWWNYELRRELALFWDTPLSDEQKAINTNTQQYETLVSVTGFGGSTGSTPVCDFLAEFEDQTTLFGVLGGASNNEKEGNCWECIFWLENNSVLSLENGIFSERLFFSNLDALKFSTFVINKFHSHIPVFDEYYLQRSKEFLFDLINVYWRWNAGAFHPKKEQREYYKEIWKPEKYPKRIEKIDHGFTPIVETIWKDFSLKEFRQKAKNYLQDIFKHIPSKKFLICDQLLNLGKYDNELFKDYFGNLKKIYVYSDPRDQYVRIMNRSLCYIPADPLIFCIRFKSLANSIFKAKDDDNVLIVCFEEFVFEYERVNREIIEFLGLQDNTKRKQFSYFNPKKTAKKIGIYKTYHDQEVMKIIERELKEYCWGS